MHAHLPTSAFAALVAFVGVVAPTAEVHAALDILQTPAATLLETSMPGGTTQYTVTNQSNLTAHPFDITFLVVSTNGTNPTTTNPGWTAEALTAASWDQPMGGPGSTLPTWAQFTDQAFPSGPVGQSAWNGYFLNYSFDAGSGLVHFPSGPTGGFGALGGFFFSGEPGSTFLVGGPADVNTPVQLGNVITFTGTSTDAATAPLPPALVPGAVLLAVLLAWFARNPLADPLAPQQRGEIGVSA
jgi:hypothetical protein